VRDVRANPVRVDAPLRSFPRKRESRFAIWVPAFAGTSGYRTHISAAISVRSLPRVRGRVGEGVSFHA